MASIIVYDIVLPFGAAIAFCGWQLWELRRANQTATALEVARSSPSSNVTNSRDDATDASPSAPRLMAEVRKLAWDDVVQEDLSPLIGRKLITSERMMLAQVFLKKGALVPAHDHHNEQFTYILSGALRFWIGEHADAPGDTFTDVRAGEVLVIPSSVRHRAEALEDTLDVDVFNPPRQDWLDGSDAYLRGTK